ncbi:DUF732 domain-containing protein [Microbacterium sp. che218]|uniref:DUF732 domain-containing protein n=1 Tax=Microbacterium sp. che218 TaxID=3140649 RepID=UPI00336C0100
MKRLTVVVGAIGCALFLAGCSAPAQEGVTLISEPVQSPATSRTDAPLTAQTPEASSTGGEAAFLVAVRANLRPDNVIPDATDAQLLAAGREACEKLAAGTPSDQISVIEGEPTNGAGYYSDSGTIITAADSTICG